MKRKMKNKLLFYIIYGYNSILTCIKTIYLLALFKRPNITLLPTELSVFAILITIFKYYVYHILYFCVHYMYYKYRAKLLSVNNKNAAATPTREGDTTKLSYFIKQESDEASGLDPILD